MQGSGGGKLMNFNEEIIKEIASEILPNGCVFFNQQRNAILADGSLNIVAGPGAGKTTVLIAKCALLLKRNFNRTQGICLITHTNVAVDEIKNGLKKLGITMEYPNFIGTIQQFFNTFFAKKAFHLILGEKYFRVIDEDVYNEKFDEIFQRVKPDWYQYQTPNIANKEINLFINDDLTFSINSNAKSSYKAPFERSIRILFESGIVNNEQCLYLTKWYIGRFKDPIMKAITNRFNYVLLDEAQDTSQLQYDLLNELFSDGIFFQRFGDPYQALYSIYENNDDAWVPSKEKKYLYQEISETTRFGTSIANVIKNLCIEKYESFQSLNIVSSFAPYFIIYENEEDLLEQYRRLINFCETKSESFSQSSRKDSIISAFHKDLEKLFSTYRKPSIEIKKNEGEIRKIYNVILKILAKDMDIPFNKLKDIVDLNLECKIRIGVCLKNVISDDFIVESVISELNEVIGILSNNEIELSNVDIIVEQMNNFRSSYLSNESKQTQKEESEFYIGTIHSVKGETHRSTLLVLDSVFKDFSIKPNTEYSMFDLLKEYLVGDYTNPYSITDSIRRNETLKSLKLAYVALSRPTHLAVIAIPNSLIKNEDEYIKRLLSSGWKQYGQGILQLT